MPEAGASWMQLGFEAGRGLCEAIGGHRLSEAGASRMQLGFGAGRGLCEAIGGHKLSEAAAKWRLPGPGEESGNGSWMLLGLEEGGRLLTGATLRRH